MSYFLAIYTSMGQIKARDRTLYKTKSEAASAARQLLREQPNCNVCIQDADHEPGKSILAARHGFA